MTGTAPASSPTEWVDAHPACPTRNALNEHLAELGKQLPYRHVYHESLTLGMIRCATHGPMVFLDDRFWHQEPEREAVSTS